VGGQGLSAELQHQLVPAAVGTRLANLKEFARAIAHEQSEGGATVLTTPGRLVGAAPIRAKVLRAP
jgi:hypothetical protein